jgi:assimilatory nitrate reductase catalytic subunit
VICSCFGVGLRTLQEAIAGRKLTSVAEIGTALRAGSNCGSCIPELKAILHEVATQPTLAA